MQSCQNRAKRGSGTQQLYQIEDLSTFRLSEQKYTEISCLKSHGFVPYGVNLTHIGPNSVICVRLSMFWIDGWALNWTTFDRRKYRICFQNSFT